MIYQLAEKMPEPEKFGLTHQMKKAAVTIPLNIAEGAARDSDQEFIHHLYISLGSAAELETQLIIIQELGFMQFPVEADEHLQITKQIILGLIRYLKSKNKR